MHRALDQQKKGAIMEEKLDELTEKVNEIEKKMNLFLERQVKILETLEAIKKKEG